MVQNGRRTLEISQFELPVSHYFNLRLSIRLSCMFLFYGCFTWLVAKGKNASLSIKERWILRKGGPTVLDLDHPESVPLSFSNRALGGQNQMKYRFVTEALQFFCFCEASSPFSAEEKPAVHFTAGSPDLPQKQVSRQALWLRHSMESSTLQTWSQTLIHFQWVEKKKISRRKMASRWTKRPTQEEQAGDVTAFSVCF